MKKRIISFFTSLLMIFSLAVVMPMGMSASAASFTPRLSAPSSSNAYYYSSKNPFYAAGYGMPNCTAYAYGRAYEILGYDPALNTGDAKYWYNNNGGYPHGDTYSRGSTPKLGSVACWGGSAADGYYGHVAIVEAISGDNVTISESIYGGTNWKTRTLNRYSMGTNFQGYIYLGNFESTPSETTPPTITTLYVEDWNVGGLGFVVTAKATDASGIKSAGFNVWTEPNGQDDIKWTETGVDSNGGTFIVVKVSDHANYLGKYIIHVYFTDNAGNSASKEVTVDIQRKAVHKDVGQSIKDGTYTLKNDAGYWMDVTGGGSVNGNKVVNYSFNGSAAQKMRFEYQGNGNYLIYPECGNGRVIDILRGANWSDSIDNGDIVDIYDKGDDEAQLFKVIPIGDGKYVFELASKQNHVIGGLHNYSGSNLYLQEYTNYSASCKWTLCDTSGNKVDACNHSYSVTSSTSATCTKSGSKTYTCSLCGGTKTETIKATGHSYTTKVVAPTYAEQGYTLHKCSKCGSSYKDNYTEQLVLGNVSGLKMTSNAPTSISMSWNKVSGATGYVVYQAIDGKWQRTKVTSGNTLTVSNLKAGTNYKFTVKAYKTVSGTNYYSPSYTGVWMTTTPAKPSAKMTVNTPQAIRLEWGKVTGATG